MIATGIANICARDPMTMAAAAKTVAELSGGRFSLGIGVSHRAAGGESSRRTLTTNPIAT